MMDSLDTGGELQVTGTGPNDSEQPVVATLEQLFTGLRVGMPSLEVQCSSCGIYLDEGDGVSVYAYRTAETPRWHLACFQCLDCESDDIQTPTRGTAEVRVRARLGVVSDVCAQQHRLCLIAPDVVAFEAPTTGTSP